ncbi:inactive rhomboid protein 1 isoform X9 [Sceloporus undulatus]|uniref:inactive rhomboid protein 1 isoform X9 n=1 Tax=Sceloporus undulatus TaxID=8520 RepID=UPI001C4C3C2E|nr:inactive rhomboid protein 1 isoform X9 [Sceloporus undulatus]
MRGPQLKRKHVRGPQGQHQQPPAEEAPGSQAGHPPANLPEGQRGRRGASLGTGVRPALGVPLAAPQAPGLPPERQHACREHLPPVSPPRGPPAGAPAPDLHHPDHPELSLLCGRQVHFERTQTLPIHGHQVGRRLCLRKRPSLPRTLLRGTADWFGISKENDATQKWQRKTLRHCSLRYGKLKPQVIREMDLPSQDNISLASTETPPPLYVPPYQLGMQRIIDPLARGRAFRMAEESDSYSAPHTPITPGATSLCSFTSSRSGFNRWPRRRKRESVAKMSFRAAAALMKGRSVKDSTLWRARPRSFTPASFLEEDTVDFPDELDTSFFAREGVLHEEFSTYPDEVFESPSEAAIRETDMKIQLDQPALTGGALDRSELERSHLMLPLERGWRKQKEGSALHMQPKVRLRQEVVSLGLQRRGQRITVPVRKFFAKEKRPYGLGMVGRLTNRTYRKRIDSFVKQQIEDMDDHRPFFTYWVTFVHSLITILSVSIYGIAPVGFSQHETVDSVLRNRGVYENVKYIQQENFWIGPSSEALIHLGAKFAPCMRQDQQVHRFISAAREREKHSACCVRNDKSGCLQTAEEECSSTLAVWVKWPRHPSAPLLAGDKRQFGSVCHQDPRVCEQPASMDPHEWPDDITRWPICTKNSAGNHTNHLHMDCVITGRPCCIGTKGVRSPRGSTAPSCMATSMKRPLSAPRDPGSGLPALVVTLPSCGDPALPGVRLLPDDHLARLGETGWLASHLHHLPAERHHRQPGQRHFPAIPCRGGPRRVPVWHPGLPLCGALPELADPGATLAGFLQVAGGGAFPLRLWPPALDRQLCPHRWLRQRPLPLLRLPALHQLWQV